MHLHEETRILGQQVVKHVHLHEETRLLGQQVAKQSYLRPSPTSFTKKFSVLSKSHFICERLFKTSSHFQNYITKVTTAGSMALDFFFIFYHF